jgi:hypothetical protein
MTESKPSLAAKPGQKGIDPRGPRFSAGITAVLLLVVVALGLIEGTAATLGERAFAGVARHPYGALYRALLRPRLSAPTELEDPVPPTFAQGVGFVITLIGAVLHLAGVPYALVIAASAAFIAAFLNSVFAYCLGCQIYLLLVRAGILGRKGAVAA